MSGFVNIEDEFVPNSHLGPGHVVSVAIKEKIDFDFFKKKLAEVCALRMHNAVITEK